MQDRYHLYITMTEDAYRFLHELLSNGKINGVSDVFTGYGWDYGYFAFDTDRDIEQIKKEIAEKLNSNGYKFGYMH